MLCSFCRKIEVEKGEEFWPFCSARCKSLDLGAWASEKYRVAAKEEEDEDGEEKMQGDSDDER